VEKRLSLALFLSFLVLVGWSVLSGPPADAPAAPPGAARVAGPGLEAPPGELVPGPPAFAPQTAVIGEEAERELVLQTGAPGAKGTYHMRFTNRGARLLDLRIGDFYVEGGLSPAQQARVENWVQLLRPVVSPDGLTGSFSVSTSASSQDLLGDESLEDALWSMQPLNGPGGQPMGAEFHYAPGTGAVFTKRVRVLPGTHELEFEFSLANEGGPRAGKRQFRLVPASSLPRESDDDPFYVGPKAVAVYDEGRGDYRLRQMERRERPGRDLRGSFAGSGQPVFIGVHDKYFAFLMRPAEGSAGALIGAGWRRVRDLEFAREHPGRADEAYRTIDPVADLELYMPAAGEAPLTARYRIYAGPKERDALVAASAAHGTIIEEDLGFFSGVARLILGILGVAQSVVGNWGWAIIVMTLFIRLLLFPINRRSQTAMARFQTKMKRIQPRIDEVKKRHEKDPAKARAEQQRIMQEEGAFPPLGGCLPIFLQIPIFIGLFAALRVDFDLRQAPFALWIQDLAVPDRMLEINFNTYLPFIGTIEYFNLLPILMVILWIWQQRSMPKPTDPQQARMMKMMAFTPILFGFLLYNYAAGLSLYMMTSSAFGIVETKVIRKLWPIKEDELEKKPKGFLGRMMEKQLEQARKMQELQSKQRQQRPGGGPPRPRAKKR
jgi:YidC/Oxa1 family membrane protein insertase